MCSTGGHCAIVSVGGGRGIARNGCEDQDGLLELHLDPLLVACSPMRYAACPASLTATVRAGVLCVIG